MGLVCSCCSQAEAAVAAEVAAAGADEAALRGVEADWGGVDDDDLPLAVLIKRLEQARVGVQLPAQEEAGEESEMWEGEEEEEEEDEQTAVLAHARKIRDEQPMSDEQLQQIVRPNTRSQAAAAAGQASTSQAAMARSQDSDSAMEGSSEEMSSEEMNSEE